MAYGYDQIADALTMALSATQEIEKTLAKNVPCELSPQLLDLCWVLKRSLHTMQTAYPLADTPSAKIASY